MTEAVAMFLAITRNGVGEGIAVDLGSNAGKSSLVAACALNNIWFDNHFYMVDLAYDTENPEWSKTVQGDGSKMPWGILRDPDYLRSIEDAMVEFVPTSMVGESSIQFLSHVDGPFGYAFIDTDDHQFELVMEEARLLKDRMSPRGLIFFHDFKNQYISPALAHKYLIGTGKFEDIEMPWEEAIEYVKKYDLEAKNESWHMSGSGIEFSTFVGCARAL